MALTHWMHPQESAQHKVSRPGLSKVPVNLRLLDEGIICTGQHCLRLGKCINFSCARGLSCIEVCEEPVAVCMHVGEILVRCHSFLHGCCLLLLILQQFRLEVGLGALF